MSLPLDVDAWLARAVPHGSPTRTVPVSSGVGGDEGRAIDLLRAAWPGVGNRHVASMALAGALVRLGWDEDRAVTFMMGVCGTDEPKRRGLVRDAMAKRAAGTAYTGWTTLGDLVVGGMDVVKVVRDVGGLGEEKVDGSVLDGLLGTGAVDAGEGRPGIESIFTWKHDGVLPDPVYTVSEWFVEGDVSMLVARGSSMKTWVALSIAKAVAQGKPWLGRYPVIGGKVAVIDFENGDYLIEKRLRILGGGRLENLGTVSYPDLYMPDKQTWDALAGMGLKLLVIDSFYACCPDLNENDSRVAGVLQTAAKFAAKNKCTVIFIHHQGKGSKDDQRDVIRGSSAIFGACDAVYSFEKVPDEECPDGVKRSRMKVLKPGSGKPPMPIGLELTDEKGLVLWEGADAAAKTPEETSAAVRERIRLDIQANGPCVSANEIFRRIGGHRALILSEWKSMVEHEEITDMKNGYDIDSTERRTARILQATNKDHVGVRSKADLCRYAFVKGRHIDQLVDDGVLEYRVGTGGGAGYHEVKKSVNGANGVVKGVNGALRG